MLLFLNDIRKPMKIISTPRMVLHTILVFCAGASLGLFSKILDCTPSNYQPYLFQVIDLQNFLSEMAIWMFLAAVISIYSSTPFRAALHVFLFFIGMLSAYYAYTIFAAGFFPKSYIMIWVIFTLISPLLAFICWYAKGKGPTALLISSGLLGMFFVQAFQFGWFYININTKYQGLQMILWIAAIAMLYKNPRNLVLMMALSLIVAVLYRIYSPIQF